MTLVSQIITDAYRQGNLIAKGVTPTTTEQEEALRYLNRLVKAVFGFEAGEDLRPLAIGRANISRPSGYPWYDTVPDEIDWFVPKNYRLMLNLTQPVNVYLHPDPDDGSRFAVQDVAGNLSTYNITVHGNGRNIDGSTQLTLNTNGEGGEWFYREDTGNWVKYSSLALDDVFVFPEEFDDFFITSLAIRLNPSYGIQLDPQSNAVLTRSRKQLVSRYKQNIPVESELALLRLTNPTEFYSYYNEDSAFKKGWPF